MRWGVWEGKLGKGGFVSMRGFFDFCFVLFWVACMRERGVRLSGKEMIAGFFNLKYSVCMYVCMSDCQKGI